MQYFHKNFIDQVYFNIKSYIKWNEAALSMAKQNKVSKKIINQLKKQLKDSKLLHDDKLMSINIDGEIDKVIGVTDKLFAATDQESADQLALFRERQAEMTINFENIVPTKSKTILLGSLLLAYLDISHQIQGVTPNFAGCVLL